MAVKVGNAGKDKNKNAEGGNQLARQDQIKFKTNRQWEQNNNGFNNKAKPLIDITVNVYITSTKSSPMGPRYSLLNLSRGHKKN